MCRKLMCQKKINFGTFFRHIFFRNIEPTARNLYCSSPLKYQIWQIFFSTIQFTADADIFKAFCVFFKDLRQSTVI